MREYRGGHVYKDLARGRWRGVVRYRDRDSGSVDDRGRPIPGPWKRVTRLFDIKCYPNNERGKTTAQEALSAFKTELVTEEPKRAAREEAQNRSRALSLSSNPTVAEYVNYYLEEKLPNRKHIEPSTMNGYKRMAKSIAAEWNGAGIGDTRLTNLRPHMVESWRNRVAQHYAAVTVKYTLRLLRAALDSAVSDELIEHNPAQSITAPSTPSKEVNFLTAPERARLLDDLNATLSKGPQKSHESYALALGVKIALLTGMREGEICAIRWSATDLSAATIAVKSSIGRNGESTYIKDAKNTSSRRTIPLPNALMDDLERQKCYMRSRAAEGGIQWSESMFVLGEPAWSERDNDWLYLNPRLLWRAWKRRVERLDLRGSTGEPPKFHDLRHTFATVAAHSGIPETSLKEILGHSSIATTHRYYIGVDDDANRQAMDIVMAAMNPTRRQEAEQK